MSKHESFNLILGNVTRDLHVGYTAKGLLVVNGHLAYDNPHSGNTAFIPFRAWGSIAQAMLQPQVDELPLIRKGSLVKLQLEPNSDRKEREGKMTNQLVFEVKSFTLIAQPRFRNITSELEEV